MTTLTIFRGISGSGKSTIARNSNAAVVSRDSLREGLFGSADQDYHTRDDLFACEEMVTKVEHLAIAEHLSAGRDVISDNTNLRPKFAQAIADIGFRLGANVEVKLFDVELDTAVYRNQMRSRSGGRFVPEDVIRKQFNSLKGNRNWTPVKPYIPAPYLGTPGAPKAILVDIDGTIAHNNGRRGFFDWLKVHYDEPDLNVMQVLSWIRDGMAAEYLGFHGERAKVILMSGRDEDGRTQEQKDKGEYSCRQLTIDWATSWDFNFDALFMRPAGDMRKDSIVKAELFDKHIRDAYDVVGVFDDRWQVINETWLAMGLKVFNVSGKDRGEF